MDYMLLLQWFGIMGVASLVIMQACNVFEQSSAYLGRNMGAGAKGSLIDAIGSSLPELLVTLSFVATGQPELILAGVAVTAGSAVFNAVLIPALSILNAKDENGNKVDSFQLDRKTQIRNGVWLLVLEGLLIWFLGFNHFTMLMGGTLLAGYVMFVMHTIHASNAAGTNDVEDYDFESLESKSKLDAIKNFDANYLIFGDKPLTTTSAWVILGISVTIIGAACHYLAVSVEGVATTVGVPVYFAAVVLAAAATSVPDTVLSVKAAQNGDYEDAVGNAIGSNIFDVTVSLAIPICLYLAIEGGALPIMQSDDLLALRYFVLGTSATVVAALVLQANNITKNTASQLFALYGVFIAYIGFTGYAAA